jgi:hypothetical protein
MFRKPIPRPQPAVPVTLWAAAELLSRQINGNHGNNRNLVNRAVFARFTIAIFKGRLNLAGKTQ